MSGRRSDELGPLQRVGAWLGLWTPPRDAVVPPVPWRAILLGAAVLVAALGAAALLVVPQITDSRQAAQERERRAEAERRAAFLVMLDREQRPRRGQGRPDPGAGAAAARRVAARAALVEAAGSGIGADAHRRTGKEIRGVECEPFPRRLEESDPAAELSRTAAAYDCVAVTSRFGDAATPGGRGIIGISFRLAVRFGTGRYAWCRIVPLTDRDRLSHPLPDACRVAVTPAGGAEPGAGG